MTWQVSHLHLRTNWNNTDPLDKNAASGTTIVLNSANDNSGDPTTAKFTLTANGGGSFTSNFTNSNTGNDAMMNGYNSLSTISWASSSTRVHGQVASMSTCISMAITTGTSGNIGASVAGSGVTTFGKDANNNSTFGGSFTQAVGTSAATANNSNYFLFENLTAASGAVNFTSTGSQGRVPITGIQLVSAVPEPSSTLPLLGALGLLGLLHRRR